MRCPVCKPTRSLDLEPLEEGRLAARRCTNCGGHWIRAADFWRWRANLGGPIPEAPAPVTDPVANEPGATETTSLRICPDCDFILARYKVGRGVPFTVDRCRNCDGAWLDGGEWDTLRARGLHDDLPLIFDDAWQRSVRREARAQATEDSFRRRLGDADYQRAREVRAWLDPHPLRSELFAYLQLERHRAEE